MLVLLTFQASKPQGGKRVPMEVVTMPFVPNRYYRG